MSRAPHRRRRGEPSVLLVAAVRGGRAPLPTAPRVHEGRSRPAALEARPSESSTALDGVLVAPSPHRVRVVSPDNHGYRVYPGTILRVCPAISSELLSPTGSRGDVRSEERR